MTTTDEAAALEVIAHALLVQDRGDGIYWDQWEPAIQEDYLGMASVAFNAIRDRLLASQERAIAEALAEAQAEISRLREALQRIAVEHFPLEPLKATDPVSRHAYVCAVELARAALGDAS